ncbi:sulfite exporter TauE/SafE family protein [Komagataeibacter rhaeticus]|nr:sulfite exporter TauE/SafE family protein [Komagataeibacter rhaeticus]WPP22675.1 sulfite exporter TauE/SafE family protein [Komagataeibacter rhaeticus]
MLPWLLILAASTAAFGLSAVSGGGAGLILMPLLGLVLPGTQVPATLSIGTAASSAARILSFRHAIRWDIVRHFAPTALPFAALGAWALSRMDPACLSLLLGLFLMGNLPLLFRGSASHVSVKPVRIASLHALGAAAGFISGFTGAVGLVFNGFYYRLGLRKEEIVATRAANEIMLHVLKIMLYATFGLLDARATAAGIAVATAAVLSSILMKFVLPYLHDRLFHHIGHAAMVIAGIAMVLAASSQIARRENITLHFAHADEDVTASLSWRRHVLAVEWEHGDELELSHWLRPAPASRPGGFQSRGFVVHVSPRTGIRTARVREGCRAAGSPFCPPVSRHEI